MIDQIDLVARQTSLVETIRAQRMVIGNCDLRIELCRSAIRGEQAKVKRLISQYRLV